MHIINEVKGEDYQAYLIGDVIRNISKYDPHSWFNDFNRNFTYNNSAHSKYILRQFFAGPEVKEITSEITEDLLSLFGNDWLPNNVRPSIGLQELRNEDQSSDFNSAVPPHSDHGHYYGFTIFLNKGWNVEWGGWNFILSAKENKVVMSTPPTFNTGVLIKTPCLHGACPVWDKKARRTIQIFYTFKNKK